MLIVHSIKVIETHDNQKYRVLQQPIYYRDIAPVIGKYNTGKEILEVTTEAVQGRRFVNYNGIEVRIGWDRQTQQALGLPFEVFRRQEKRRESDYKENAKLRKRIRELEEVTFWKKTRKLISSFKNFKSQIHTL